MEKENTLSQSEIETLADELETHFEEKGHLPELGGEEQYKEWEKALEELKERKTYASSPASREFYYDLITAMETALDEVK